MYMYSSLSFLSLFMAKKDLQKKFCKIFLNYMKISIALNFFEGWRNVSNIFNLQ